MQHKFKKQFGQNFISDVNLLKAIVSDAKVDKNDQVLEIGAGGGALTKWLSQVAEKVVSYEIDLSLESQLLSLGLENVKFVFKDALKAPIEEIEKDFDGGYKLVANLPYYITSPLIFKFLSQSSKVKSLTIMVQKEVAERIVAKAGSKDFGVLSLMCQFYSNPKITRNVGKQMFFPQPKVDSALVHLEIDKKGDMPGDKFYECDLDNGTKSCYIENVIEANLKACLATHEAAGQAFNIAYGGREYLIDIYYTLAKALEKNIEPIFGPDRAGDIKHSNATLP